MRKTLYYFIFTAIIGLFFNCNRHTDAPFLLTKASLMAEVDPEKSMLYLDSIQNPSVSLSRKQYMKYAVTRVQVRYKNFLDITSDTVIFEASDYFIKQNVDFREIALSLFYSGCVRREQKRDEEAMAYYKEAESYSQRQDDLGLRGLINYNIGDLLSKQGLYQQALDQYKVAAASYQKMSDNKANTYSAIGRMFMLLNKPDSALFYFHRGLEIADSLDDIFLQSQLSQNLGVAYKERKLYSQSEKYLQKSFDLNTDTTESARYLLNFAKLYREMQNFSATNRYANKLKTSLMNLDDNYFQVSALDFLSQWEKEQGNSEEAFGYLDRRLKVLSEIMEERIKQSVYEIEQKYNYEHIQKQYYLDLSVRQQWIITLLAVVLISGILFSFYVIKQKSSRAETQRNIETLTDMNRDLERAVLSKQLDLRKHLLWRFDVTKKVMKLNREIEKSGRNLSEKMSIASQFNKIVYGDETIDEQWDALLQTFRKARPRYVEKIREAYPNLTEAEFRICLLTYADFSVKEIAVILKQSPNTVQTRRTIIRQKLGVSSGGDIAAYLDRMIT